MSALTIKTNIRDLVAELIVADFVAGQTTSTMVPITTLAQQATAGATQLHLTPCLDASGRTRIREGSRLTFYDALGERTVTVSSITSDGATATLETSTTLGFSGLAHTHPVNTKVYANVLAYGPWDATPMMALGDPVLFATVYQKTGHHEVTDAGWPVYVARVQSNRLLEQPDDTVDPESWAQHCEDSTIGDLDRIATMLGLNQQLITDFAPAAAVQFGHLNTDGDLFIIQHRPERAPSKNGAIWHYVGAIDLIVLGEPDQQG